MKCMGLSSEVLQAFATLTELRHLDISSDHEHIRTVDGFAEIARSNPYLEHVPTKKLSTSASGAHSIFARRYPAAMRCRDWSIGDQLPQFDALQCCMGERVVCWCCHNCHRHSLPATAELSGLWFEQRWIMSRGCCLPQLDAPHSFRNCRRQGADCDCTPLQVANALWLWESWGLWWS